MRNFVLFVVLITVAVCSSATNDEKYSDKYDYLNAEEILKNDRLRDQYYNCFMKSGPCRTPDAVFFKDIFVEAIVTQCRRCTEKQKESLDIIAEWYTNNQPDKWEALIRSHVIKE